jgi:hypothetical protein
VKVEFVLKLHFIRDREKYEETGNTKMLGLTKRHQFEYFDCLSALQKSTRRCEVEDGCYYAAELDLNGNGNALFGRFCIYADEDIGLSNAVIGSYILSKHEEWKKILKEEKLKNSESWKSERAKQVITEMTIVVMEVEKSRVCATATSCSYAMKPLVPYEDSLFKRLKYALITRNEKEAVWLANLIHLYSDEKKVREVFDRVIDTILGLTENSSLLYSWIEDRKKMGKIGGHNRMFLTAAVLLFMRSKEVEGLIFLPNQERVIQLQQSSYDLNTPKREIQDHMYDKHTNRGKNMGCGIEHFYEVGVVLRNPGYPDLYLEAAKRYGLEIEKLKYRKKDLRKAIREGKVITDQLIEKVNAPEFVHPMIFDGRTLSVKKFEDEVKLRDQIQINVSNRPKTYFGNWSGFPVFVKGPCNGYPEHQIFVDKYKKSMKIHSLGSLVVKDSLGKFWLVQPDATRGEIVPVDEKKKDTLDMVRSSAPRLGEYLRSGGILSQRLKDDLVRVVFFRYVLMIGDTNSRNIIIDKISDRILGVDENGKVERVWEGHPDKLFSTGSRELTKLLEENIRKKKNGWKRILGEWRNILQEDWAVKKVDELINGIDMLK